MITFERVKELAKKQGKSLQQVSEDLNFSPNYFYRMKTQQPTAEKLKLIADYFNVSVDYLLGRTDTTTPPENWKQEKDIPQDYIDQMFVGAEGFFGEEMTPHDREVIEALIRAHIIMKHNKND